MQLGKAIRLFLDGYFSTCKRSAKTIKAYTIDLEQLHAFLGGRTTIEGIAPEVLEGWAAELKEAGYASASIRRKFATLRVFFNYWVRRRHLDRSPLWQIRLDLAPERVLTQVLTMGEAKRLLLQAKRELGPYPRELSTRVDATFRALRNLVIVEVLFATGIRVGELVSLELADFRSEERAFTINGKGSRQRIALLPDRVSYRTVNTYVTHRCNIFADHEALFLNTFSGPLSAQGVGIIVGRLARDAGITRRVTPHMLRHTVASLLLRAGADIRVVQEFLGHAAISTTQRYTHITKDDLASKLNQYHPNILYLGR